AHRGRACGLPAAVSSVSWRGVFPIRSPYRLSGSLGIRLRSSDVSPGAARRLLSAIPGRLAKGALALDAGLSASGSAFFIGGSAAEAAEYSIGRAAGDA